MLRKGRPNSEIHRFVNYNKYKGKKQLYISKKANKRFMQKL